MMVMVTKKLKSCPPMVRLVQRGAGERGSVGLGPPRGARARVGGSRGDGGDDGWW